MKTWSEGKQKLPGLFLSFPDRFDKGLRNVGDTVCCIIEGHYTRFRKSDEPVITGDAVEYSETAGEHFPYMSTDVEFLEDEGLGPVIHHEIDHDDACLSIAQIAFAEAH